MSPVDAHPVRFRRPAGRVPHALALALVAAIVVLGGVGIRLSEGVPAQAFEQPLPLPPAVCPGHPGCTFSELADEPSPEELYVRRMREEGLPVDERYLPLGLVELRLAQRREAQGIPIDPTLAVRIEVAEYARRLADDWVEELRWRGVAVREENRIRRARFEAGTRAIADARREALRLRGWEIAILALAAAMVLWSLVDRRRRFRPVSLDAHGVRAGTVRLLWEELVEARWQADHVELVRRDGGTVVLESVALGAAELVEVRQLSERLLRRERAAPPPSADLDRLMDRAVG